MLVLSYCVGLGNQIQAISLGSKPFTCLVILLALDFLFFSPFSSSSSFALLKILLSLKTKSDFFHFLY